MVSKHCDNSLLKAIIDVIGFLLLSAALIIRSIVRAFLPSSYKAVKNLDGEIAVITGAGSGIGRELAMKLAKLGTKIVIWDINSAGIDETVKLIKANGGTAHGYQCNVADREDVYRTAKRVENEVGEATILINNAGVASGEFFLQTPDHLIERTFNVNIIAHFWTTKAFLPNMIKNNHGHIVTIASMAGHAGIRKLVDYCSSKFAAVGFDEALRVELESLGIKGVKTLVVCPYFIQATGMFDDVLSRFVPRLSASVVVDRIILGIRREELYVMIPTFFRYVVWLKWILPWEILSMLFRNLVPDASPSHVTAEENGNNKSINGISNGSENHTTRRRIVAENS